MHHGQGFAEGLGERADRQGDRNHIVGQQRDVAVEFVRVEDDHTSRAHFRRMPFHGVLIQRDNRVQSVPMGAHLLLPDAHAQPDMSATDDGLVAVIREQMQAHASARLGECVSRLVHPIARCPSDSYRNFVHRTFPFPKDLPGSIQRPA